MYLRSIIHFCHFGLIDWTNSLCAVRHPAVRYGIYHALEYAFDILFVRVQLSVSVMQYLPFHNVSICVTRRFINASRFAFVFVLLLSL